MGPRSWLRLVATVAALLGLGLGADWAEAAEPSDETPTTTEGTGRRGDDKPEPDSTGPSEPPSGSRSGEDPDSSTPAADTSSPFGVSLEIEQDPKSPERVVVHAQILESQIATIPPREARSLTVEFGDGRRRVYDLTKTPLRSVKIRRSYEPVRENQTYTVLASVRDNEEGVGQASQQITIPARYDVRLSEITFGPNPWGGGVYGGGYDCDDVPLQGKGDFSFEYRYEWRGVSKKNSVKFDLGNGETKKLLPGGLVVRDVTTEYFPQLRYSWVERDFAHGNPFKFDPRGRTGGPVLDLNPTPDEITRMVRRDETDLYDCQATLSFRITTVPHTRA